jgi:16S rRNA (guanine527-N7)-methyltransferase
MPGKEDVMGNPNEGNMVLLQSFMESIGLPLRREQQQQFSLYRELLLLKNQKMNLTAIDHPDDVEKKHFIDSLCIIPILIDAMKTDVEGLSSIRLIDVGSGAGFPGIPLKIVFPGMHVTLLDSTAKRVQFLREVLETLGIRGAETIHSRAEDLARNALYRDQYSISIARAVAPLPTLCEYGMPFVMPGQLFVSMKGRIEQEELLRSTKAIQVLSGKLEAVHEYLLPGTEFIRSLVLIRKTGETPNRYPRKPGKPSKTPI